ncbi:KAP family P-loop NTPase fold protein [Oceanithermus sp.]
MRLKAMSHGAIAPDCLTLDREPLPELALGADKVVSAVQERIKRHFAKLDRGEYEEPLVVGILGEWGSGKTLWLKSIERAFARQLESDLNSAIKNGSWPDSITVPVFFNAWRYEKEEHLIYPLIKVLERKISAMHTLVRDCLSEDAPNERATTTQKTSEEGGDAGSGGGFLRHLERAWELSRRLLAATGAGIVALGSGITLSGRLKAGGPILSTLFDGEVGVQISGKSITDLLVSLPKTMREEAEVGRAVATGAREQGEAGGGREEENTVAQGETLASLPESLLKLAERARSDYYDFHRVLRDLTGRKAGAEGPKINLLFFIDDLDRCLPEKAVEMLEAIKLFLEVEGTAFVLALDDEVVERGIAHRYRDYADSKHPTAWDGIAYSLEPERYREFLGLYANNREEPVTGHEYMEKIVHLQVRIPRVREVDAKAYLLEKYPSIFGIQSQGYKNERTEAGQASETAEGKPKEQATGSEGKSGEGEKGKHRLNKAADAPSARTRLLDLFASAVPPVPRKLIRSAELLSLKIEAARKNGWDPTDDENELYTLAQLTIVQLFAPELYRFALKNRFFTFLQRLEGWLEESYGKKYPPSNHCLEELERAYREGLTGKNGGPPGSGHENHGGEKTNPDTVCKQKPAEINPRLVERLELPLVDHVIRARRQRSGFDPFNVVLDNPEGLYGGLELEKFFMLRSHAEEGVLPEGAGFESPKDLPAIEPEDPLSFIEQLTTLEPAYWQNALQDPGVQGKRGHLTAGVFEAIKERLPQFDDPDLLIRWLELLEPLLSAEQLDQLVTQTQAFSRILKGEIRG